MNASIIELHGAFEDQAREDLMLRVLFGAIGVRIGWQGVGGDFERRDENGTRGFAGDAHECYFCHKSRIHQGQLAVLYRAGQEPIWSFGETFGAGHGFGVWTPGRVFSPST